MTLFSKNGLEGEEVEAAEAPEGEGEEEEGAPAPMFDEEEGGGEEADEEEETAFDDDGGAALEIAHGCFVLSGATGSYFFSSLT